MPSNGSGHKELHLAGAERVTGSMAGIAAFKGEHPAPAGHGHCLLISWDLWVPGENTQLFTAVGLEIHVQHGSGAHLIMWLCLQPICELPTQR